MAPRGMRGMLEQLYICRPRRRLLKWGAIFLEERNVLEFQSRKIRAQTALSSTGIWRSSDYFWSFLGLLSWVILSRDHSSVQRIGVRVWTCNELLFEGFSKWVASTYDWIAIQAQPAFLHLHTRSESVFHVLYRVNVLPIYPYFVRRGWRSSIDGPICVPNSSP